MIKILTEEEGPLDVLLLHFSTIYNLYTISYFLVMVALLSSGRKKAEKKNYGALCWDITTHCHLFTNLWKFLPLTILARYSYSLSPSQVTSDKEKFLYELDELQAQMEKAQLCTNRLQQEKEDYQMDAERQREKCEKLQVRWHLWFYFIARFSVTPSRKPNLTINHFLPVHCISRQSGVT